MGVILGYNAQQIRELNTKINSIAQSAERVIVDTLRNGVVVPMSAVWYAPEAITFFTGFKETVKTSGPVVRDAFDGFREAIQMAGSGWAENTGGEAITLSSVEEIVLELDISSIKNNNGGNVGIDEEQARAIASGLGVVESDIKASLESLAATLSAESAFLGNNQGDSVSTCFVRLSGEIHKIFKYLTEGDTSLSSQITKAADKYKQVSSDVASAFSKTE